MIYQCLVCGESFKESDGQYNQGWLCCPICHNTDLIVIWDETKPATSVRDFGIEKELANLKAMRVR